MVAKLHFLRTNDGEDTVTIFSSQFCVNVGKLLKTSDQDAEIDAVL